MASNTVVKSAYLDLKCGLDDLFFAGSMSCCALAKAPNSSPSWVGSPCSLLSIILSLSDDGFDNLVNFAVHNSQLIS